MDEQPSTGRGPSGSADPFELDALLSGDVSVKSDRPTPARIDGAVVGRLVGLTDNGATPLVVFPGQPEDKAQPARATVDLHRPHIGRDVVLMFDEGNPRCPIVVGCIRTSTTGSLPAVAGHVEVEADGERLVVSARTEIVLRCGQACITLSQDGEVVIRGKRVVSHASGVNRIRGGSIQLN